MVMSRVTKAVNLGELGVAISGARKTKSGAILLEVKGGPDKADVLAKDLQEKLGEEARIGRPEKKWPILIFGIPEWAGEEEVCKAINEEIGSTDRKMQVRLGPGVDGTFFARMEVPASEARSLQKKGRIKIGWAVCRVKVLEAYRPRCFKCLEAGHLAAECKGPDRKDCCFRCLKPGHRIATCDAPAAARVTASGKNKESRKGVADPEPAL